MTNISSNTTLNDLYVQNLLNVRTKRILESHDVDNVGGILALEAQLGSLDNLEGFGPRCMYYINLIKSLMQPCSSADELSEGDNESTGNPTLDRYYALRTPEKDALLNDIFERELQRLPKRAKSAITRNYPTFRELIAVITPAGYSPFFKSKTRSLQDVERFLKKFVKSLNTILDATEEEWGAVKLNFRFPFLNDEEAAFSYAFEKEHGHLPLFFLVKCFVANNDSRTCRALKKYYGIETGAMNIVDIAAEERLCVERVRQLVARSYGKDEVGQLVESFEGLNSYEFLKKEYVLFDDAEYNKVRTIELGMCPEHVMTGIMNLLGRFLVDKIDGKFVFVSSDLMTVGRLKELADTTYNKFCSRRAKDISFTAQEFMEHKRFSDSKSNVVESLVADVFSHYFGAQVKDGLIILKNNRFNCEKAVKEVLSKSEVPVSFEQIYCAVMGCEGSDGLTEDYVKYVIKNSDDITSIGKTGTYTLAERGVYTGTIRDLVEETLMGHRHCAMHIEEIANQVLAKYPNSNKRSIQTSLDLCPVKFKSIGSGYYALA